MSNNSRIPSLYFSKAGSAASWCLTTDTELRTLAAGIAKHASPTKPTLSAISESAVSSLPCLDQPTFFPRVHADCKCSCHGTSCHGSEHVDLLAATVVELPVEDDRASTVRRSLSIYSDRGDIADLSAADDNSSAGVNSFTDASAATLSLRPETDLTAAWAHRLTPESRMSFVQALGNFRWSGWLTRTPFASTKAMNDPVRAAPVSPVVSIPSPTRPRRPSVGPDLPQLMPVVQSCVIKQRAGFLSSSPVQTRFVLPSIPSPPPAHTRRPASLQIGPDPY